MLYNSTRLKAENNKPIDQMINGYRLTLEPQGKRKATIKLTTKNNKTCFCVSAIGQAQRLTAFEKAIDESDRLLCNN